MKNIEEIKGRCFITEDGHWLWRGAVRPSGRPNMVAPDYTRGGMFTQCGTRAVWHCQHQKPLPKGWRVWGTCEELTCCNPAHVTAGTPKAYGRWLRSTDQLKGKTNRILANRAIGRKRSVVDPETIAYIQASPKTRAQIARELGISPAVAGKARRGEMTAFKSASPFAGLGGGAAA